MKKLRITSIRHDGPSIAGLVAGTSWVSLKDIHQALAKHPVQPMSLGGLGEKPRRALFYEKGRPPIPATIRRNMRGIFLKIDGQSGATHSVNSIRGLLFQLEAFPILNAKWTAIVQKEISTFKGKNS